MTSRIAIKHESSASKQGSEEKTVSIVARAISVLHCFDADHQTLALTDLAAQLALPKPTVFRIASVLLELGFLERTPSNDYTLGLANSRYAQTLLASMPIRGIALPVMEWLRDEINETIILSVREGDFRFNIDSVECTHPISQAQQIGAPIPLYAGAASRVMLAAVSPAELDEYLQRIRLVAFSKTTITAIAELKQKIQQTRKDGFSVTSGEFTSGGHAVAALIEAPQSFGITALHVSIPQARYSKTLIRKSALQLQEAIQRISKAAGKHAKS